MYTCGVRWTVDAAIKRNGQTRTETIDTRLSSMFLQTDAFLPKTGTASDAGDFNSTVLVK